jgi:two-component system sensor kinase FixL
MQVNHAVREVMALLENELRVQAIRVRYQLGQALPNALADRVQVQQVMMNLIRNAIEALFETEVERRALTITTALLDPGQLEICVGDSGTGATPEILEQLFRPFFTTKPRGMGLGLSISRRIVEAHGGRLEAAPNPGGGLTFRFTLPTADDE